ncbi:MAG: 50S ribosomal protein L15 [Elusimicrobia bacterium]|nr:50S ribosomal protein L15 [Elusimicrobiota bacterium]
MNLTDLKPAAGSTHKKKILGHGRGSGHGGSSTRGTKGQKSTSGGARASWFEGGQMPLLRRIPKRGFTNKPFRKDYACVNVGVLEIKFSGDTTVTPESLFENGLITRKTVLVKILGNGDIRKPLKIRAHKFSKQALEKINACGGTAETIKC